METYFKLKFVNNDFYDSQEEPIEYMKFSKKLNIFVGENNSGKSRLIKEMFSEKNKTIIYDEINDKNNYTMTIKNMKMNLGNFSTTEDKEFLEKMDKSPELDKILLLNKESKKRNKDLSSDFNYLEQLVNRLFVKTSKRCIYIPILRGNENFEYYFPPQDNLNSIQMNMPQRDAFDKYLNTAKTIYKNKVSNVYSIKNDIIYTSENLYDEITDILLGEEQKREKFHEFEKFISDNFYNGEHFSINPNRHKNCLYIKIGSNKEYEIHNMGDGIKQIITILYPIFKNKEEKMYFFIEEPEINLHPGFQRKLMEILLSNEFKNHKFFITSHSNHIMDIVNYYDDVELFKFQKKNKKIIMSPIKNDYLSLLNDLGVNASATMLSNCSIWVEGISDRIYLKKYLELYFKEKGIENKYKENIHYCFVEYSGSNITHWNFEQNDNTEKINTKYLNHNSFLIVDNDDSKNTPKKDGSPCEKEIRKRKLEKELGECFYEYPKSREIENTIKLEILEKMLKKDNNLATLARKKYINNQEYMYKQELISKSNVHIAEFIENTYLNIKKYRYGETKDLANKYSFSKSICEELNSYDDLTEEAKELTEKVVSFIEKNNQT